jgi:hypothetical protein
MDSHTLELLKVVIAYLVIPFYTSFGCFILYILNRSQGKQPFSLFRAANIDVLSNTARPYTIFVDMILSSMIGAAVVIPLTSPTTVQQAIIAGLGMTGILATHTREAK